ncbi:hypothetical protein [uncultured Parolsenella sp.]|uniref:hypothetical protein n=1 Tax=uncultured Parolsenella sp. TaxID=2083008 RepID=UPI0027D97C8E|nr:hypothetical protein [uncultured Parolsenella sp.]
MTRHQPRRDAGRFVVPHSALVIDTCQDARPPDDVSSTLAFALADFADALAAYDRMESSEDSETREAICVEVVSACPAAPARAGACPSVFDVVVVGMGTAPSENADGQHAEELAGILASLPVRQNAAVYGMMAAMTSPSATTDGLDALAAACPRAGLAWAGGLVLEATPLATTLPGLTRMGGSRRPVSECVDDLICALRSGLSVADAARLFSWQTGGTDEASPSVLRARWGWPLRLRTFLRAQRGRTSQR